MKKKIGIVAMAMVCLLAIPNKSVLGAGAELPSDFKESTVGFDVVPVFDKYQGESTSYTYEQVQENKDAYYYEGNVEYVGKDGISGAYHYFGDKESFKLVKIVKADGSVILNPQGIN